MTAFTDLLASDTMFLNSLEFDLNGPTTKLFRPGHKTPPPICIRKVPGQLSFTVNTVSDLGFNPAYDFDVEVKGRPLVTGTNNPAGVTWEVDQPVHRDFPAGGLEMTIHDVKGSITTDLVPRSRTAGEDCLGASRSISVDLRSLATGNRLKVWAALKGLDPYSPGLDLGISLDNISLLADARDKFAIDAQINAPRDACGIYAAVPGGTQEFWAQINNLPAGETPSFAWSVTGSDATLSGPADQRHAAVKMGSKPDPFVVTVVITVGGISQTLKRTHTPDTAETVAQKTRVCRLVHLVRVNLFTDPLWDPLRDRPVTRSDLRRLDGFSKSVQAEVTALSGELAVSSRKS